MATPGFRRQRPTVYDQRLDAQEYLLRAAGCEKILTDKINALVGKPIAIKLQVSTPTGVKWVRLRYRNVNQKLDYQTIAMTLTGEKDAYSAMIPAEQINPKWDVMYFIEVMDKKVTGQIYPDLN